MMLVWGCLGILAAQIDRSPQFEVASLKPSPPPEGRMPSIPRQQGGPGTADPARITYRNMPLPMLITRAYEVDGADVVGPAWAAKTDLMGTTDKYDIDATLSPEASQEQFRLMLQNLLAERFGLKVHREKKEVPAYALVVAKNGPKLKESPAAPAGAETAMKVDVRVRGEDGFPATPPGYSGLFVNVKSGHTRVKFIGFSMGQFAKWTRGNSKRPGVDQTGLTGRYDFYLEFGNNIGAGKPAEGGTAEPIDQAQDFAVAIQTQLGLKLAPDKTEIEFLVIDQINRTPVGN
jgi:uncharacterized protein (TIGR03435 family)